MEPSTVSQLFVDNAHRKKSRTRFRAFLEGAWRDVTWDEFYEAAREIALGLRTLGLEPGDRACIFSESRVEWTFCDVGIFGIGAITVPIYATLPSDQAAYIARHCEAAVLFADDEAHAERIRSERASLPALRHIVVIDGFAGAAAPVDGEAPAEMSLADLRARGRRRLTDHATEFEDLAAAVKPEDIFTIIYTSGTTGTPKGVVTTHANYVAMINMVIKLVKIDDEDVDLLFLPLAHAYARLEHLAGLAVGHKTAFARGIDKVAEDLQIVRPTLLFSVPRIYEKAYAKILAKADASSPLKKKLFYWSLGVGREVSQHLQKRQPLSPMLRFKYSIATKLVFGKVKEVLGGRLKYGVSAAAAISREILEFFHACGVLVLEGYGMTECSTASHINPIDAYKFGTVGRPLEGIEQRIAEDGEILLRGPNVMKEYYKMPAETAETIKDGWLHTGDIGVIDEEGYLRLTDRKKVLFKTSGGKYIAPTPIENAIKADPRISQVVVHGDARKYCVALVTLNQDEVLQHAREQGWNGADFAALIKSPQVKQMVQEIVDRANAGRASFETIKKFAIIEQDFSIEGGELTPTLKVKRKVVEERYGDVLDGMYEEVYR